MWRPAPEGVRPARRAECSRTLWPYRHVSRGAAGFNLPFAAPGSRRLISGAAETAALPSHGRRDKPSAKVAASEVDAAHGLGGVARAGGGARRRYFVNARQVLRREQDFHRPEILVQISASLGADEGNNLFAARQQPGKRELRGRAVFLPGDLLDAPDKLEIALEIFSLEARRNAGLRARLRKAPARAPCPARPALPWLRPYLPSGCLGRRDAGSKDQCARRPAA